MSYIINIFISFLPIQIHRHTLEVILYTCLLRSVEYSQLQTQDEK